MTTDNSNGLARVTPSAIIPRTIDEVARLAKMAAASGLAKTTSPEAAGMLICAGLEIGLTPMQALLGMHMIEGRPTLAADTIVALIVRRTDVCEYWRSIESTPERHTIETKRRGEEFQPVRRTWTLDDAKRAGLTGKTIWQRYPVDMLRHRCATSLAREVFPDIIAGMAYTREEISDGLHNGDDEPQPAVNLADPNGSFVRPAIDAQPSPLQLPRDNGPGPSGAPLPAAVTDAQRDAAARVLSDAIARAADPAEAPAALPSDLSPAQMETLESFYARVTEIELPGECVVVWFRHRADLATLPVRERENGWKALCSRCEEVGQMKNAKVWLKKAIAEEDARRAATDGQKGDPTDDGPPKPRGGPRKARTPVAPADATGGGAEGADGPVGDPSAIDRSGARASNGASLESRDARRRYLATLDYAPAIRTSAQRRSDLPHYADDCAERLCALDPMVSHDEALAYLDAAPLRVVSSQPKTRAA